MDATETWTSIPGYTSYEVSAEGVVRSWKRRGSTTGTRAGSPHTLIGHAWRGDTYYNLEGRDVGIVAIMLITFGERESLVEGCERQLDSYALREIRGEEGLKTAGQVGRDFRLDPVRVRNIWDGLE